MTKYHSLVEFKDMQGAIVAAGGILAYSDIDELFIVTPLGNMFDLTPMYHGIGLFATPETYIRCFQVVEIPTYLLYGELVEVKHKVKDYLKQNTIERKNK